MALSGALGLGLVARDARDAAAFCVASVAQSHWQALHNRTSIFVSRGRRCTISHPPSFRVAGVALMALSGALGLGLVAWTPVTPRQFAWQAWHNLTSTFAPSFCVACRRGTISLAGVAEPHMHLCFTWQALHNLTSTFVSRGRPCTISHPPSFRVAGVALMALNGALGLGLVARDARDAAAVCVAGVAQSHTPLRFAWHAWHNLTSTFVSRGMRGTHGTQWRAWTWFGRP